MSEAGSCRYRRSPHLLAGWDGGDLVLHQCDTLRRFRVDHRLLDLLSRLGDWASSEDLATGGETVPVAELARLVHMGLVEEESATSGRVPTYWSPFDLAVHRQANVGGYREDEVRARVEPPPPAFMPRPAGTTTTLPAPGDLTEALGTVLSRRRSVRTYAERPLRLGELSTALHHAARVVRVFELDLLGEHALRPYAAGGARSELELYVVANDVDGLAPGAHYYDARAHDLVEVRSRDEHQDGLNRWLFEATGQMLNREPPVVLIITAVFARVMWKYRGIALGLINRNVGCLLQTLYLTATASGLAPCAVGAGQEVANARWLGLDPLVESQVGCLLLGPRSA